MGWRLLISLILCYLGMAMIVVAYQVTIEPTPEWCFDLQSLGTFLFMTSPFFLIWAMIRGIKFRLLDRFRIPTIIVAYTTGFDFGKEIVGLNQDNGTIQILMYWIGLTLFTLYQYAIIKRNTHKL